MSYPNHRALVYHSSTTPLPLALCKLPSSKRAVPMLSRSPSSHHHVANINPNPVVSKFSPGTVTPNARWLFSLPGHKHAIHHVSEFSLGKIEIQKLQKNISNYIEENKIIRPKNLSIKYSLTLVLCRFCASQRSSVDH